MTINLAPGRPGGLRLRHPVLVAAGGAGYGNELLELVGSQAPAAVVTRSVTREARPGNRPPRMVALPDGLLSSIGPQNPGLEAVLRRQTTRWGASEVPVVISISADSAADIAALASSLEMHPDIAAIELNLATPDHGRGGAPIGHDEAAAEVATVAARAATELPLIVKLPGDLPDARPVARAVAAAGADAISAIAPLPALALTHDRGRALLGTAYGGLSGPAIKHVGLRVVYQVAQVVRIPVIGIGGIASLADVLDYLAAGASAVGIATAALADSFLPGRLGDDLAAWCVEHGVADTRELSGRALPHRGVRNRRGGRRSGR